MQPAPTAAGSRPRPQPVAGSEHRLAAERVIVAIGQRVEIPARGLAARGDGTIGADADTMATGVARIFAGGDAVSGPASVIEAIAHGQKAAAAIDRCLGGGGDLGILAQPRHVPGPGEAAPRGSARAQAATLALPERLHGFALIEQACDAPPAMQEAARCLGCDLSAFVVSVDAAVCKACGYCAEVCGLGVFAPTGDFNAGGYQPYRAADSGACVGCLECLYVCPDFAITVSACGSGGRPAAAA
jgi:NAD-dependent dihydropyrimidine dehydrogenase PreA subunit